MTLSPLVQVLANTLLPTVGTQLVKPLLKRYKWLLPILSAGLGAATSCIPGFDQVSPGVGAALGLGSPGAYYLGSSLLGRARRRKVAPAAN